MIIILKQINKPWFEKLVALKTSVFHAFNFFVFAFLCKLNLGGLQLFLQIVFLNKFGSHKKKVENTAILSGSINKNCTASTSQLSVPVHHSIHR